MSFDILTPERVSLQYEVAGVGSRGAALLVDAAIQGVVALAAALLFGLLSGGFSPVLPFRGVLIGILVVLVFLVLLAYFPMFEIIWSGQTPGKRLLGLRVIRETGYPIRPTDAVIRNLVRLVDLLPGFYAVGVIAMLLNRRAKRLGDFAAGTLVVRVGPAITPARVAAATQPVTVASLSSEDATLVRDFLLRRQSMDPDARGALASRLASALATRYALPPEQDPETFLQRLV